ncbi:hypothetical protein BC830DRAFT_1081838 [Chytriomyces sp. MP71]|nr:hypothetical protein BC830DRAFT_1081838 [Chytriomyces sp. MP71]
MSNQSPNIAIEERRIKNMLAQRRHRQAEKSKIQDLEATVARLMMQLQQAQQYPHCSTMEAGHSSIYQTQTLRPPPTNISAPSSHLPTLVTAHHTSTQKPPSPAECQNCHFVREQQDEFASRISRMQQTIQQLQAENHTLEQLIVRIMQDQERLKALHFPTPSSTFTTF